MERLARQVQQTQQVLAAGDAEWGTVADALDALAGEVEALTASNGSSREAVKLLQLLSSELGAQITGYRSKLVGHVCKSVARIASATKRDFRDLANDLLPALVNTAKGASGAVRTPGAELFRVVSEQVRFDLQLFRKIFVQSPHEKIRVLMLEQVAVILACWLKHEIEPHDGDVLEIIRRGLLDPAQSVRSASRDAICAFAAMWEEHVDELVDIPSTPAQELLLKEKPHAAISLAILKKHPELQKKATKVTASSTSKKIARQRSLVKMGSQVVDQTVEIHVATPPEKQRGATRDTSKQVDSQPGQAPLTRRLFQDDDAVGVSSSSVTKPTVMAPTSAKAETSIPKPAEVSLASTPVPPVASRPDDSFRRSRIAEGSKIPAPPSRSPTLRTTHAPARVFGNSRSQDSPPVEQQPSASLIPRRAGSTSALTSFKPPSTKLARRASHDTHQPVDDAAQSTSVSTRDHFLDHPIPSSAPSPVSVRSESNVTVRARRRPLQAAAMAEEPALPTKDNASVRAAAAEQPPHAVASAPVLATSPTGASSRHQVPPALPPPQFDVEAGTDSHLVVAEEEIEGLAELELSAIIEEEPRPPAVSLAFKPAADEMVGPDEAVQWTNEDSMQWESEQVQINEVVASESESFMAATDAADTSSAFGDAREEDSSSAAVDALSSDGDIEETMLISPDVVVQDHFRRPDEPSEQGRRDKTDGDNLPRDALTNLIGIQQTMVMLQALTKIDARGVPLKPRLSPVVESPVARPRSAGRVSARPKQILPQSRSQDDLFRSKPLAIHESVGNHFEYVSKVVATESTTSSSFLESEEKLTVEARDGQASERRGEDFQYPRGFRPPSAKRSPRVTSERTRRQAEQPESIPQRRRRAVDRSADVDWIQVERQFQGIVRESEARQSQASSAELTGSTQEESARESSAYADVGASDASAQVLEPPIQLTVKSAAATSAVSRRNAFTGHRIDTARSQADPDSSVARHSALGGGSSAFQQGRSSSREVERRYSWPVAYAGYFLLALGFVFGVSGLLRAVTTVRDTHDYHQALKTRISLFEASISESYDSVCKLEENYAVWSEYVRMLAEEDESHSLSLLETIQHEVERWQHEMQSDLAQFKRSLSVDVVEAALAPLLQNATTGSGSESSTR